MSFTIELLAQLQRIGETLPLPRVRALHLPPDPRPGEERGEFCAVELVDGSIGLSYVLLGDTLPALRARSGAGLPGAGALEVAAGFAADDAALRTIGFAAANAVTRFLFDRAGFVPASSADSVGALGLLPGDRVGMIGFFAPLLPRVRASGAELVVVELRAELLDRADGFRVTLDADELRGCSKVLATGTLLLNGTLDAMLERCTAASRVAIVGPSVGCVPDALFARGITFVGGTWIDDRSGFVDALRAGERRADVAHKFGLRREDYPGLDALLARVLG
jgi:uncharacterized protein (DUF4213/DUF364 family)